MGRVVYTVFDRQREIPSVFLLYGGQEANFLPKGGMRVGEQVELIEQDLGHLKDDMREAKKRLDNMETKVNQLESNTQLMQQSQAHLMDNVSELKAGIKMLGDKWDEKWEQEKREEKQRYEQNQRDQRNRMWGFALTIIAAIVLVQLGLK